MGPSEASFSSRSYPEGQSGVAQSVKEGYGSPISVKKIMKLLIVLSSNSWLLKYLQSTDFFDVR